MTDSLRRVLRPAVLFVLLMLVIAGCAGAGGSLLDRTGGGGNLSTVGGPIPEGANPIPGATAAPKQPGNDLNAPLVDQTLIIKNGTLQLQVDDVNATVTRARTVIQGFAGYVSGSQQTADNDQPVASITYRIPAVHWDDAVAALRGLGKKVVAEKTEAVEVTGQVLDLGARIDNLQATEKALQAIMVKATKISDILEVQSQLTAVQGQIEQLATEKSHLEQQAAYGTLTVGFESPAVAVTTASRSWSFGEQVDKALAQLVEMGQGVATAVVWFAIVILPPLLALGFLFAILLIVLRRVMPRRPTTPYEPPVDAGAASA